MKKNRFFSVLAIVTALFMGFTFAACSSDDDENGDNNNGKIDPSTIATTNLIAYFPFEDNGVDLIASLSPAAQPNVSYVTGRRGKAYQGAENAYFLYNLSSSSKLATMTQGFTVSAWIKPTKVYGDPVPMIFQIGKTSDHFWGNLTWMQERAGDATAGAAIDSCYYKFCFQAGGSTQWLADGFWKKFIPNTWQHLTLSYDGATSQFSVYINGVLYPERSKVLKNATGQNVGNLTFTEADKMVIGGWLTKILDNATDAWMGWFKGNLDEFRVYDKGLTATEVKNLYDAEVTQIN